MTQLEGFVDLSFPHMFASYESLSMDLNKLLEPGIQNYELFYRVGVFLKPL